MKLNRKPGIRRTLSVGALALALTAVLLAVFHPQSATAFGDFLTLVETKYPSMVGSRIDNCTLCHIKITPLELNPFGSAFQSNGESTAALTAIANLDSDHDGFTNQKEILAKTYPGDATDHPPYMLFVPEVVDP